MTNRVTPPAPPTNPPPERGRPGRIVAIAPAWIDLGHGGAHPPRRRRHSTTESTAIAA